MKERPPLFIELWDPWCEHCKAFKPDWEKLTSLQFFDQKIVFGDINCVIEKKLCQKISPGKEYPRFVWINHDCQDIHHYIGSYSLSDLASWLDSQLRNNILHVVNDSIGFEKIKHHAIQNSLFRFIVNENDKQSLEIISRVVKFAKYYQVKMVATYDNYDGIQPQLNYYSPDFREVKMKEEFKYESLIHFIKAHAMRFFLPYNGMLGQFSLAEQMPIMIFVFPHNSSDLRKIALEAAKLVDESNFGPVSQMDCDYNDFLCRYYGVRNNDNKVSVVVINKSQNVYWKTHLNHIEQIPLIKNWTDDILQDKAQKLGPGSMNPFLGSIVKNFLEFRGLGGWKYYIFFLPFIIIFTFFITLIAYISFLISDKQQVHNKKEKKQ